MKKVCCVSGRCCNHLFQSYTSINCLCVLFKCGSPFVRGLLYGKSQHLIFKLNQGMVSSSFTHLLQRAPQEHHVTYKSRTWVGTVTFIPPNHPSYIHREIISFHLYLKVMSLLMMLCFFCWSLFLMLCFFCWMTTDFFKD